MTGIFSAYSEVITIVILGSICGLKNVSQIHQWAANDRVSEFFQCTDFRTGTNPCAKQYR